MDFCEVVSRIGELCDLDPPPSESRKVRALKVERHFATDQESVFSYLLLIGEMREVILKDISDGIVSPQSSMWEKKLISSFFL